MPLPLCQRGIQLPDIEEYSSAPFLSEFDSISSLFIYPTDAIPTHLLNKTTSLPDRFNAYIIRHYWNTVCCQFWTPA